MEIYQKFSNDQLLISVTAFSVKLHTHRMILCAFSVKAMLLIIDCKKKITWKKMDHIQNGFLLSDGKVALEEKELIKSVENGEAVDKIKEEVMHGPFYIVVIYWERGQGGGTRRGVGKGSKLPTSSTL